MPEDVADIVAQDHDVSEDTGHDVEDILATEDEGDETVNDPDREDEAEPGEDEENAEDPNREDIEFARRALSGELEPDRSVQYVERAPAHGATPDDDTSDLRRQLAEFRDIAAKELGDEVGGKLVGVIDGLEKRVSGLDSSYRQRETARFQHERYVAMVNEAHAQMNKIGGRFGTDNGTTHSQRAYREAVWGRANQIQASRPNESWSRCVRAAAASFLDDLSKESAETTKPDPKPQRRIRGVVPKRSKSSDAAGPVQLGGDVDQLVALKEVFRF